MKRLILIIKWLPFALMVLMVLHCGLLMLGIESNFLSHASVSPLLYITMMLLSYKMKFCFCHRMALTCDFVVWCFCLLRDYGLLDGMLLPMRMATFTIGIILITITLYEKRCRRNDRGVE